MQKVAVVTGSAKGLGRSIALALSKEGFTLVIHYHKSKTDARKVLREIRQISGDSISFGCDLRSSEGALDLAKEELETLDARIKGFDINQKRLSPPSVNFKIAF